MIRKKDVLRTKKGLLTIEAAITMPIFIAVVFGIAIFMKAIFFHGVMQNALDETTNSLATFSYIYHGFALEEKLSDLEGINSILSVLDTMDEAETENIEILNDVLAAGIDDVTTRTFLLPIIKTMVKGHFVDGCNSEFDARLISLHVSDGLNGLDFTGTRFLADEKTIEIMVRYKLNLPNFMGLLPDIIVAQRASARAWLNGNRHSSFVGRKVYEKDEKITKEKLDKDEKLDEKGKEEDDDDDEKYVWLDGNFARGRQISEIFGRNLPSNFPTIAKFKNGRAISITSIDPTSSTYLQPRNLRRRIMERIEKLAEFEGANWAGVDIVKNDIKAREVLIIFPNPRDLLTDNMNQVIADCRTMARDAGVRLRIEHFGVLEK